MKKFFNDFKAFIMKGNIIDMAVGVVIGAAFGKIVTSLVNDIITPLVSILTGKVSLTELKWIINEAVLDEAGNVVTPELALTYGVFLQSLLDFLIIALAIFVVLRIMTTAQKKFEELTKKKKAEEEEAKKEEAPKETELTVLCEIREMLKAQQENKD